MVIICNVAVNSGEYASMKWRVPGQEIDQRRLGERLWKKDCQACNLNREDAMDRN